MSDAEAFAIRASLAALQEAVTSIQHEVRLIHLSLRSCQGHCHVLAQRPKGLRGLWNVVKLCFVRNPKNRPAVDESIDLPDLKTSCIDSDD